MVCVCLFLSSCFGLEEFTLLVFDHGVTVTLCTSVSVDTLWRRPQSQSSHTLCYRSLVQFLLSVCLTTAVKLVQIAVWKLSRQKSLTLALWRDFHLVFFGRGLKTHFLTGFGVTHPSLLLLWRLFLSRYKQNAVACTCISLKTSPWRREDQAPAVPWLCQIVMYYYRGGRLSSKNNTPSAASPHQGSLRPESNWSLFRRLRQKSSNTWSFTVCCLIIACTIAGNLNTGHWGIN